MVKAILPVSETLWRLVEAAGPMNQLLDRAGREQIPCGQALVNTEVLGAPDDSPIPEVLYHASRPAPANGGITGGAAYRIIAFLCSPAEQQVGNPLFRDDVADIVAVDHHRWQVHANIFLEGPGVKSIDEGRLHLLTERFNHLHHQLPTPRYCLAVYLRLLTCFQPGRLAMASPTGISAKVR